jgi:iron complex outermembrane receptor protein
VAGAALQYDSYDARDVSGFDFNYSVPALFAQDEYAPFTWLTMAASARLDSHSEYGEFLSPRFSLLLRPEEWVIRISAGNGYFAPTPFTEETDAVGLGRLQPNAELVAERASSAMVDAGRMFGPVELNVSAFASEIDDALVVHRVGDGTLVMQNSPDPVNTWGTEVLARYSQGPIRLTATHAYLRSRELDPTGSVRREVPLTPRHSVGMVGAWEEDWGRAGLELYFTGRQELDDNPYRSVSEPHFILGFLIDRRFGPVRLFLNAENILDTRQTAFDPLLRPAQTPDGRWVTDVWAPLDGRSLNGGVWISF